MMNGNYLLRVGSCVYHCIQECHSSTSSVVKLSLLFTSMVACDSIAKEIDIDPLKSQTCVLNAAFIKEHINDVPQKPGLNV